MFPLLPALCRETFDDLRRSASALAVSRNGYKLAAAALACLQDRRERRKVEETLLRLL